MKATNFRLMTEVPLSLLLEDFLRQNHKEMAFQEHAAVLRFGEMLPEEYAVHIQKVWAADGKLYVKSTNAGLRFELLNRRTELCKQLNELLQQSVIQEIVVL